MAASPARQIFNLQSLTDDALIEVFRFVVLVERHAESSSHQSWLSLAETCPRFASIYMSFLKTYCIDESQLESRFQACPQCSSLYDHVFYLSITKLASPRISVLKIPPTCVHMKQSMMNAIAAKIPNLRHFDCTRVTSNATNEIGQSDIIADLVHTQKQIATLSICNPVPYLLSCYTASLSSLRRLELRICSSSVVSNLTSFLNAHGQNLEQILVTVRNPPQSHGKCVFLVEDALSYSNNIPTSSFPLAATMASILLQRQGVSAINISNKEHAAKVSHEDIHCPLRISGQCDFCTQVDMVNYFAKGSKTKSFRRPHCYAFVRTEDPTRLYQPFLMVPPRPRFKLTLYGQGLALELKKGIKSDQMRETMSNILRWSPIVAVSFSQLMSPQPNLPFTLSSFENLQALEIGYDMSRKVHPEMFEQRLAQWVIPVLRRAKKSLASLSVLTTLNLTEDQFRRVLRLVCHVSVLEVGSTFILHLFAQLKLSMFFGFFRNIRVLKIITDDSFSCAILTPLPELLRCVKKKCPELKCIVIKAESNLDKLATWHYSLITGSIHAVAESRRALNELKNVRSKCDFSNLTVFLNSWELLIRSFFSKIITQPPVSPYS